MATNARIYYPIAAIGFARLGTLLSTPSGYRAAKGVQSLSFNTTFALEQVFQLGQLSLYENIENLPNVELTVEKIMDGNSLIEHLATPQATSKSLAGRYNDNQSQAVIAYYPITNEAASGMPLNYVQLSGLYVSSINWNLPVEGNITESITLTCRDKQWLNSPSGSPWASGNTVNTPGNYISGPFTGTETTVATSGGTQRRQHVVMANSVWPSEIPGISANANPSGASGYGAHIQNITIAASLGRTDLFEQGRRGPYFRYANFPVQVTTSIAITATELGDAKNAFQDQTNLTDQPIKIYLQDGVVIDLGTKNKLASVNLTGPDTGGANQTVTYNYQNFNDYTCTFPNADPAGLS